MMMMALAVGDVAPLFETVDAEGDLVRLRDYLAAGKWVVLFFYPKDHTPGCTQQVCAFRDAYEEFHTAGAVVLGVSSDTSKSHQQFANTHQLQFPLIPDKDGRLRAMYQVPKTLGILPGRVTYVIDPQGVVRHIFNSQMDIGGHIFQAIKIIS